MLRWLVGLGMVGAGMVAGLVAPAFACSSLATMDLVPDVGPAGTTVAISVTGVIVPDDTPRSDGSLQEPIVTIKWGGEHGRSLGTATADAAGVFRGSIVIPPEATVAPGRTFANYALTAVLPRPDGTNATRVAVFEVEPSKTQGTGPTTTTASPTTLANNPGPNGGTGTTLRPGASVTRDPAPSGNPAAARPVQAPGSPTPAGPGQLPAASPAEVAVAEPGQAPVAELDLPAPNDIWSGLGSQQLPSLLERQQAPGRRDAPSGAILLGAGLVMLAALALVGARRRLALARR